MQISFSVAFLLFQFFFFDIGESVLPTLIVQISE